MNWTGKKVLVTGADGFIGSHLAERLVALGADVRAFCLYNSNGSLGWLDTAEAGVRSALDVRLGDIRDARFVEEACAGVDTVFHLAALIAIPYSYQAPESFVDTNINGTLNILEGVRRAGCRRIVQTSTSEVYGTPASLPILESHPLQGQSPYSASKIAADKLCEAYYCSFGVPVVTVRPFNTYGPRQSTRAVLPTMLVQLLSGQTEIKLGRVDARRDLTFVADTVEGMVLAGAAAGIEGDVIQLGTGRTVSIAELFEMACTTLGVTARIVQDDSRMRPDASEVMVLLSDPARARERLGWEARVPVEEGLARTVRWLEAHLDRYEADRYHV
ncbi:MAG: SDR family NAD(P)-dependent oxidoreductase [Acidobacteriota bacterium]|nr:SDR family NAD(P)-dependent oxidoreductase [Acidobacteriota bacterium]